MQIKIIEKIKEPYWSAGMKYHFVGPGVGVNIKAFDGLSDDDLIEIPIVISKETQTYRVSKRKARELYKQHNSHSRVKGVDLVILPIYELEKIVPNLTIL